MKKGLLTLVISGTIAGLAVPFFVSALTLQDYWNTGQDNSIGLGGTDWVAQGFTTNSSYSLAQICLDFGKTGTPGTITVSIRSTLTGSDLTSGTDDSSTYLTDPSHQFECIAVTPYTVTASTLYWIVVRANSTDLKWWQDTGFGYGGGQRAISANSGVTWDQTDPNPSRDMMFETWSDTASTTTTTVSKIMTNLVQSFGFSASIITFLLSFLTFHVFTR